jgi:hypothetical protein
VWAMVSALTWVPRSPVVFPRVARRPMGGIGAGPDPARGEPEAGAPASRAGR